MASQPISFHHLHVPRLVYASTCRGTAHSHLSYDGCSKEPQVMGRLRVLGLLISQRVWRPCTEKGPAYSSESGLPVAEQGSFPAEKKIT